MGNIAKQLDYSSFYYNGQTPADYFPEEHQYYISNGKSNAFGKNHFRSENLSLIIQEWKELNNLIKHQFSTRNSNNDIKNLVLKGCALYLKLLFWSNDQPVSLNPFKESLDKLEIKPLNIYDRISFIISHPGLYPSFVQLEELFIEQQKCYAKFQVIKKRASK